MGFGSWVKRQFGTKKGLLGTAVTFGSGGLMPLVSDKIIDASQEAHKGLGNMVSGGYIAQKEATDEAKKARDQAQRQYDAATAATEAEAARLANLEEERKKRLALYGNQLPSTLMGSYTGLPGGATVSRATLG